MDISIINRFGKQFNGQIYHFEEKRYFTKQRDYFAQNICGQCTAGTAFIALGPVSKFFRKGMLQEGQGPADATKFRFHMIGNAHIVPVWLWPWSEGISVVYSRWAINLLRENASMGSPFR